MIPIQNFPKVSRHSDYAFVWSFYRDFGKPRSLVCVWVFIRPACTAPDFILESDLAKIQITLKHIFKLYLNNWKGLEGCCSIFRILLSIKGFWEGKITYFFEIKHIFTYFTDIWENFLPMSQNRETNVLEVIRKSLVTMM